MSSAAPAQNSSAEVTFGDQSMSVSRVIDATPEALFSVVANPAMHEVIDGSGTVHGLVTEREGIAQLGDKFSMKMRMGVPYRITSEVVEFEENRLIAWAHIGGHRWRYEFEPVDGGTKVTETFDTARSKGKPVLKLLGYPAKHQDGMIKTLDRLAEYVSENS